MAAHVNNTFPFQLDEFYLDLQKDGQEIVYIDQQKIYENPFPGLRPFKTSEVPIFKGRDNQVAELLTRLSSKNFLAVIGSSGTGKSSLIRAGLIPQLSGGYLYKAGSTWNVAICRPGDTPIQNLAISLASLKCGSKSKEDIIGEFDGVEDMLLRSTYGIIDFNASIKSESKPSNLLIIIDQFEEIFRYKEKAVNAELENHFINLLLDATTKADRHIYVIITMRSEFLGNCVKFRNLPEAINAGQYLVPQLSGTELRKAIVAPIERAGQAIEPALVEILINEIEQNEVNIENLDYLPILQHALMRTYKYALNRAKPNVDFAITIDDYEAVGGMKNALDRHAENAFEELSENKMADYSEKQLIAKTIFQLLTDSSNELKGGRRPVEVGEVYKVIAAIDADTQKVNEVIDHFRSETNSFIMPNIATKLYEDLKIDISHESLMRNWDRLKHWMDEEVQHAALYKTLNDRRILHSKKGLDDQWITGGLLDELLSWRKSFAQNKHWAKRYHALEKNAKPRPEENGNLFESNIAFLSKSEQIENARRESENKARASKLKWRYISISVFITLIAISLMYMRVSNISNAGFSLAALNNLDSIQGNKIVPLKIAVKAFHNFQLTGIPNKIRQDGINSAKRKIIDLYNFNNLGAKIFTKENGNGQQVVFLRSYVVIKNDSLVLLNYGRYGSSSSQSYPAYSNYNSSNPQIADTSIIFSTTNGTIVNRWPGQAFWLNSKDLIAVTDKSHIYGCQISDKKHLKRWGLSYNAEKNGQIDAISYFKTSTNGFLMVTNTSGEVWVFDTSRKEPLKIIRNEQTKKNLTTIFGRYFLSNGDILILKRIYKIPFSLFGSQNYSFSSSTLVAELRQFDKDGNLSTYFQSKYDTCFLSDDRTRLMLKSGKTWMYFNKSVIEKLDYADLLGDFTTAKFDLKNNILFFKESQFWIYDKNGRRTAMISLQAGKKSLLDFQNGVVAIKIQNQNSLNVNFSSGLKTQILLIEQKRGLVISKTIIPTKDSYTSQWFLSNEADSLISIRNENDSSYISKTVYQISDRRTAKVLRAITIYNNDSKSLFLILNSTTEQKDRGRTQSFSSSVIFSDYRNSDYNKHQIKYFEVNKMQVTIPDNFEQIIDWADTVKTTPIETKFINKFIHHTNPWTTVTN